MVTTKLPETSRGNSSGENHMDCKNLREVLDLYVDGELSPEATVQAGAHLAECPSCKHAVDRLNQLRQAVKAAADQYGPTPQLEARVRKSTIGQWGRPVAWVSAVAAVLLIGV